MGSDTELLRRFGCRFSLEELELDTPALAAEAVETEQRSLGLVTASFFDLIATPRVN